MLLKGTWGSAVKINADKSTHLIEIITDIITNNRFSAVVESWTPQEWLCWLSMCNQNYVLVYTMRNCLPQFLEGRKKKRKKPKYLFPLTNDRVPLLTKWMFLTCQVRVGFGCTNYQPKKEQNAKLLHLSAEKGVAVPFKTKNVFRSFRIMSNW